jgi:CHAD domain-containing protein
VLRAQIERARRLIRSDAALSDRTVHEFRKELKKARATLRLLRCGIDRLQYRLIDAGLQQAAKPLAPLRDARVLADALRELRRRHLAASIDPGLRRLGERLAAERASLRRRLRSDSRGLKQALSLLAECQARTAGLDASRVDAAVIGSGMRRVYRSARRTFREARAEATVEALHAWRKQAKYLLNQLDVAHRAGDRGIAVLREAVHELVERLGEDHDLAILSARIAEKARSDFGVELLGALIGTRRGNLQREAFGLGRRIFRAKPKALIAKLLGERPVPV